MLYKSKAIFFLCNISGNLTGSSLAPEATSYDFTTSVTVANSEFYQRIFGNQSGDGAGGALTNQNVIKLEWNEINQHGCMFSYVEVLKQMAEFHKNKAVRNASSIALILENVLNNNAIYF